VKSEYNSPIHAKKRLTIEEELYKIKADLEMLEQKR